MKKEGDEKSDAKEGVKRDIRGEITTGMRKKRIIARKEERDVKGDKRKN